MHNDERRSIAPKFPGIECALDGDDAVMAVERSTGESKRATDIAVTAGMSMTGLRSAGFTGDRGVAHMHESLYAAAGKRLTYVLNVASGAVTKHASNPQAGHDDYHAVDDTGLFHVFAQDVQEAADLTLIAHRIAELSLNPGICAQDRSSTGSMIESIRLPEPELISEFLGKPGDLIESPTPAQRTVFGESRRRIPVLFDYDYPAMFGALQNQDAYQQGVAAQRPFFFDHVAPLADRAFAEFRELTGRRYGRATGYRIDDAEYVILGQGSVVHSAEAVCDRLRATRGLAIGVLTLTMFRPFPADSIVEHLGGRKAVLVLERVDQPLAVDPPILKEIRAAMGKAVENGRGSGATAHAGIGSIRPADVPDFFSGCFGLGGRELRPADIVGAVQNVLPEGAKRRQFYLGIDFIRKDTRLPKLQILQEELLDGYPDLAELAVQPAGDIDLSREQALALRIHSLGGWGVISTGKKIATLVTDLLKLRVKGKPMQASEKRGWPTTFFAAFAPEAVRIDADFSHVDVVLSADPTVFRHCNPLAGMRDGGIVVTESDLEPAELWAELPAGAQREIKGRGLRVVAIDAAGIARDETADPELRKDLREAALIGAFFRHSGLMSREGLKEERLFEAVGRKLGRELGDQAARASDADELRAFRRGFSEGCPLPVEDYSVREAEEAAAPSVPEQLRSEAARAGVGHPGRFWERVGHLHQSGVDGIADPFAALGVVPAATSSMRDLTDLRVEVPEFIAEKCTGCGECWTHCPDAAIPGVVSTVEETVEAAIAALSNGSSFDRLRQIVRHLGRESRRIMKGTPFHGFGDVLAQAYKTVSEKVVWSPERRRELDEEFAPVFSALTEFPLAKTEPFYDVPEGRKKGTGGLLSVTIDPKTCKGCNICIDVCEEDALRAVKQDAAVVETLRRNWKLWEHLPETDDSYVGIDDLREESDILPRLLLKKSTYFSMLGGDGGCAGCGEKTAVHLVLCAVQAVMAPRVRRQIRTIEELVGALDEKARSILASDADLEQVAIADSDVQIEKEKRNHLTRIVRMIDDLKDLKWRYTEGPGGRGRASAGFANAAGCSATWGATYPFNPYPFPWTHHLSEDAPSIALGLFEGHMRKMAVGFAALRRARLEIEDRYDQEADEAILSCLDWRQFTDGELGLCPPLFAVGGGGVMADAGLQHLSRLLVSGKPIRVIVVDAQAGSGVGSRQDAPCAIGEMGKETALVAMAHRGAYVLQTSQAQPSHLLGGTIRGLQVRRPALFLLHTPCPPTHGIGADAGVRSARLAMESRAFPLLRFDPDRGAALADCLSLNGNPNQDELWATRELNHLGDDGEKSTMSLPVTIADWAATEARFERHFTPIPDDGLGEWVAFHEYIERSLDGREGVSPFIFTVDREGRLHRMSVSQEMVELGEDRRLYWSQLRQMAGIEISESTQARLDAELEAKTEAIRAEYEGKIRELRATYPAFIALRMAEALLRTADGRSPIGGGSVGDAAWSLAPADLSGPSSGADTARAETLASATAAALASPATAKNSEVAAEAPLEEDDDGLGLEPYIESIRCTACNECTNLNRKLFAYNDKKQAIIADAEAGSFKDIVTAAEKCPVRIIHPGTPLNPDEKDLEKWIARADPFN